MSSALTVNFILNDNNTSSNNIASFSNNNSSLSILQKDLEKESKNLDDKIGIIFDSYKIIYCSCCMCTPKLKFNNINDTCYVSVICEKGKNPITIKECLDKYIYKNDINLKIEEKIFNLYCRRHEKQNAFNKYKIYCSNCKFDLCEDCIIESKKRCEYHDKVELNLEESEKKFLLNYLKNNKNNNTEYIQNFCELIEILLYMQKEFPNIRTLKSLKSIIIFLQGGNKVEEIINVKIIKKIKDLPKKNKNSLKKFSEVKAFEISIEKQNFRHIKFLSKIMKNIKNDSLIKLSLAENKLRSIKPLSQADSKYKFLVNLKHLDLSRNLLDNKNIKYLKKLSCKNIKFLYLTANMFTDYNIFNIIIEEFNSNLKIFYIGFNRFEGNIQAKKIYNFPKLKKLGLNYVFNENNYLTLTKFEMENLEELYIQNNGIVSMDFLQNMNLPKLREIYLANNESEEIDINHFKNFVNLERIFLDYSTTKIINLKEAKTLHNFQYIKINNDKIKINQIKETTTNDEINNIKDVKIEL